MLYLIQPSRCNAQPRIFSLQSLIIALLHANQWEEATSIKGKFLGLAGAAQVWEGEVGSQGMMYPLRKVKREPSKPMLWQQLKPLALICTHEHHQSY